MAHHEPRTHRGVELKANLKSISHRCHLFEVAFEWELTQENHPFAPGSPPGRGRRACAWDLLPKQHLASGGPPQNMMDLRVPKSTIQEANAGGGLYWTQLSTKSTIQKTGPLQNPALRITLLHEAQPAA